MITFRPRSSSRPSHSGGRDLSQICRNDRRFGPPPGTAQRDVRTCVGETDRNRVVLRRKLLQSHRPTQFVRLSSHDWCHLFDIAPGRDFSDAVDQIDAASACRTGVGKVTSYSHSGRERRRCKSVRHFARCNRNNLEDVC